MQFKEFSESNIYFSSDLHLGHENPLIYEQRGFRDIESHDKAIIDNINKTVSPTDNLFLLGDICMKGKYEDLSYVKELLSKIRCMNITVVAGNHETLEKMAMYKRLGFTVEESPSMNFKLDGQRYLLSHYPTITQNFNLKRDLKREVINLYGHTHQKSQFYEINGIGFPLNYHIGVDSNELCPVRLDIVLERIEEYYNYASEKIKDIDIDEELSR